MSFLRGSKLIAVPLLRFALVILSLSSAVFGANSPGTVSVAWSPNTETNVAGYKIYWGEVSRHYTKALDVGSASSATLTGLTTGLTYFCAVTAYNTDGQESPFSAEISLAYVAEPAAPDTSARLVLLEAESGQFVSPMAALTDSGVTYVTCPSYPVSGSVKISFSAPMSADYYAWARVKGPTSSSDSFWFTLDDSATEEIFHVYGAPEPSDGIRSSAWMWKRINIPSAGARIFSLNAGTHSIKFRAREQNALIDRLVFSSDPNFLPTDDLPRSGDALAVTAAPSSLTRNEGEVAIFAVTAAATGPVSYQWKKNGVVVPGATSATLLLSDLEVADAGNYSVALTRGTIAADVGPAALVVSPVTTIPVFRVSRLTMNPDLSVAFQIEGALDASVLVYASSDLTNWTLISAQVNSTGEISVTDPAANGKTQRFYRLDSDAIPGTSSASGRTSTPEGSPTKDQNANPGL